ncbi:MAG: hypothetical protein QOH52_4046 [Pseudonocardiales bacterium]|jgi:hypothetical protein|nr:hypothetical protein [Pseudonocardiales bacterium]
MPKRGPMAPVATLEPELSDRILVAISLHLPDGVIIERRGKRAMRVRYQRRRFERFTSRSAPFAHIRGSQSTAEQVGTGLQEALRCISRDLSALKLRWPGLAWGPVEVHGNVEGDHATATVTDVTGNELIVGPVRSA